MNKIEELLRSLSKTTWEKGIYHTGLYIAPREHEGGHEQYVKMVDLVKQFIVLELEEFVEWQDRELGVPGVNEAVEQFVKYRSYEL